MISSLNLPPGVRQQDIDGGFRPIIHGALSGIGFNANRSALQRGLADRMRQLVFLVEQASAARGIDVDRADELQSQIGRLVVEAFEDGSLAR